MQETHDGRRRHGSSSSGSSGSGGGREYGNRGSGARRGATLMSPQEGLSTLVVVSGARPGCGMTMEEAVATKNALRLTESTSN